MRKTGNRSKMLLQGMPLFLVLVFIMFKSICVYGQVEMVTWGNNANNLNPTILNTQQVTSTAIILGGGVTAPNIDWAGIRVNNFHNTLDNNINYSKYLEFRISPNSGYLANINQFRMTYNSPNGNGATKLQIRYSTDPSFPSNGTLLGTEQTLVTGSNQNLILNFPTDFQITTTLYIRLYLYGHGNLHYSDFYILTPRTDVNNLNLYKGPTIWGSTISASSTIAINDVASTYQNFPTTIEILENDEFSNLGAINITQQPSNGQVVVNGLTNVTYTPNTNYLGSDSFKYTITDENGTSQVATVNVTVDPVEAPIAVTDNITVMINSPLDINVLSNDLVGSGTFDQITVVSNPNNGSLTVNPDKTITYTPNNGFIGNDVFQYQVSNIYGAQSNIVSVNITVNHIGLVVWDGAASGFLPKYNNSYISASNITHVGSGALTNEGQYSQFFKISGWPTPFQFGGGLNPDKYLQFTLSPVGNHRIDLDKFNFSAHLEGDDPSNYEIRFSKSADFSNYHSVSGGLTNAVSNIQVNLTPVGQIYPGESLYIRIYVFNGYNSLKILHNYGNGSGPTITGSVVPIQMADLELEKQVNSLTPNVNDNVQFSLNVTNNGPTNATNVDVTDLLPSGYQFVSASSASYNSETGKWSVGNLAIGASTGLSIIAKVLKSGEYMNTATVSSSLGDPDLGNNTASAGVTPIHPDVGIALAVNNSTPNAGENVTFTITSTNNGPGSATGIAVTDLLPSGFTYVSNNPSVGTYNQNNGVWTIGTLSNGTSATLQIVAKVKASGNYENTATITIAEEDSNPNNNSTSIELEPIISSIDLGIEMSIDNSIPEVGQNVTFTITVTNLGVQTATGVEVIDQLPSGFAYVGSSASVGTYNSNTGKWNIGNLSASGTATLTITGQRLASGLYSNNAVVSHSNLDPNAANNSASAGLAFSCEDCTHNISGGAIVVNPGEVWCLESGSWSGGVTMNGGTVCISPGATFSASYTLGALTGTIINNGVIEAFPMGDSGNHSLTIYNYGEFTTAYLQNYTGSLYNYGELTINGDFAAYEGSTVNNYNKITTNAANFNGTLLTNYPQAEFRVNNTVDIDGGYWENKLGGKISLNGASIVFIGDIDNLGEWEFERISAISSTLNNYGEMKVHNAANNISSTTYLTNDGLLEFIDVDDVQYNGPMLTNNGTITISAEGAGHFKMNQAVNQVYNNGLISITGEFQQNAAGNKLENNCTINAKNFFVGNGTATNNGLINVFGTGVNGGRPDGVNIEGAASFFINGKTGFVQAVNFRNSGHISGYGSFYFTGTTNNQSSGTFIGNSPTEQILFFDATPPASGLFDLPGATTSNVIRPDNMSPQDLGTYNCEAPPTYAGSPPVTNPMSITVCDPEELPSISFDILDYATPAAPINGDPFGLLMNSIRLFEFNNIANPTNNTTSLTIAGKGTLSVDGNGLLTFVPDPSFTSGIFEAEYRISNKRSGDVITYPSPRTKITIKAIYINLQAITSPGNATEVCVGGFLALSNAVEGGKWTSSNPGVATVNEDGLVTGISEGSTTITYTKTEEDCVDSVQMVLTIKNCEASSSKLISNPMIRQRVGGEN